MINKSISELYDSGYISGDAFLYYAERNLDTIQDIMDAGVLEEELAPYGKETHSIRTLDSQLVPTIGIN